MFKLQVEFSQSMTKVGPRSNVRASQIKGCLISVGATAGMESKSLGRNGLAFC